MRIPRLFIGRITWLAAVLFVTIAHHRAHAQLGLDKVLDNFTDLSLYVGYGGLLPTSRTLSAGREGANRQHGLLAYGTEFSFELGSVSKPICTLEQPDHCYPDIDSTTRKPWSPRRSRKCSYERTGVTALRVEYRRGSTDSVLVFTGEERCKPPNNQTMWLFELAVGYSQLERFYSADVSAFTLNGSLKTFPTVAMYATYEPPRVSPYVGFILGITKLEDLQLSTIDTSFTASPSSVDAGAAAGLVTDYIPWLRNVVPFGVFSELSYHVRTFPSIRWSAPKLLPLRAPRRLNLSGWDVKVGFQASVKKKDAK